jgi:hypothetical protein
VLLLKQGKVIYFIVNENMIDWNKNHSFLMGALGSSLKYTKNLQNALEYFNLLEAWFDDEEIASAIGKIEFRKMFKKNNSLFCQTCGNGDPKKVGNKTKVADDGFTCKECGATYI